MIWTGEVPEAKAKPLSFYDNMGHVLRCVSRLPATNCFVPCSIRKTWDDTMAHGFGISVLLLYHLRHIRTPACI